MSENTLLSNLRDDVGIVPYANGEVLTFNRAGFKVSGFFPSSVPGCARSTFPGGEGDLRRGLHTRGQKERASDGSRWPKKRYGINYLAKAAALEPAMRPKTTKSATAVPPRRLAP